MLKNHSSQRGQTLIETLVACFILVMGITAALSLATYSLNATSNIKQQTIGMGLAREGLEMVKNMRDTNWLRSDTLSQDCYNFSDPAEPAFCYKDWLNPDNGEGIDISGAGSSATYSLRYTGQSSLPWSLVSTNSEFGLNLFSSLQKKGSPVFYNGGEGVTPKEGNSGFARKITISQDTFAPFDHADTGPRLKVTSQVWWTGKGCDLTEDFNPNPSCSITLQTYLTNWRVF